MDQQLIALYELKRQSFLIGYIHNPQYFSPALAFAYYNRVAPIFHENIAREKYESDPFEDVYAVKASFVDEVTKYVDECDLAGNLEAIGFYKLEERFGGYKANRIELLHSLEYARIDGRFSDAVWKAIEANAPAEANRLDDKFPPSDIHFG
jgi:hypothetical protein